MLNFFKNLGQSGQSVVEYVLLLSVISLLSVSILKSDALSDALGEDSELMNSLVMRMEYSYRHGGEGMEDTSQYNALEHHSYRATGGSAFFLPELTYPEN